jgi:flagellar biosynthesis GTPase FlhF
MNFENQVKGSPLEKAKRLKEEKEKKDSVKVEAEAQAKTEKLNNLNSQKQDLENNMVSPEQSQSPDLFVEKRARERDERILEELGLTRAEINELEDPDASGTTSLVSFVDRQDRKVVVKKGINVDPDLNARREYTFLRLLQMRS